MLGAAVLACVASSASAQFPGTEDFDSYAVGQLDGQGGWGGWGGFPTSFANVTTMFSRSAPHSAEVAAGADSVNQFQGLFTSGQWNVETWVWMPTGFLGKSYFITMNTYTDPGPYEWNGQVGFNGDTGRLECDCGTTTTTDRPLAFDQWIDLRFEFDFDTDNVDVYWNTAVEATPIASYPISGGVFGQDAFPTIQVEAIDLYPDAVGFPQVTPVYFDDISIETGTPPAPGTPYCFGDGSGTPCPCGNTGGAGEGCANGGGSGGLVAGNGSASVGANDLLLEATQLRPNQPGLAFSGLNQINGGNGNIFGDGLRCAGNSVQRLGTKVPNASGAATWGPGLNAMGGWAAGDQRFIQVWYRDPAGSPCGAAFNLTNGLAITFTP